MKAMDIEKLLHWAYCEELPKLEWLGVGFSAWSPVEAFGELLAERDDGRPSLGSRYAVLYAGGPHPDAEFLANCVKRLDDRALKPCLEDPAFVVSDMPAEVQAEAEEGVRRYGVQLAALVVRCARLKTRPEWRTEIPVAKPVVSSKTGKPLWFRQAAEPGPFGATLFREEIVGLDPRTHRPPAGAYRKFRFEPPVWSAVADRMDYLCWRAALGWLAVECAGQLANHVATGPEAPAWPWEGESEAAPARVLPLDPGGFRASSQRKTVAA